MKINNRGLRRILVELNFDDDQDDSAEFRERFEKYPHLVDKFIEFVSKNMNVRVSLQSVADYLKLVQQNQKTKYVNMTSKGINLRLRNRDIHQPITGL